MTTFDQREQAVERQVNVGGDADIGILGDNYNYQIGQAQFNLPPQLIEAMLATFHQDVEEDFTLARLEREVWEPETVYVPAGSFLMGSEAGNGIPEYETPSFKLFLPAFRIGKYPVTNAQYAYFLREANRAASPELGWDNGNRPSAGQNNMPVKGVCWFDALAYCVWLIEHTGRPYSLPSEGQWEKAARGSDGKIFPWGDEWQDGRFCNTDGGRTTAVDAFPEGAGQYGCLDMVGNVREWTTTLWGRNRRHNVDSFSAYPWLDRWEPNVRQDYLKENQQIRRVTRGGASLSGEVPLRASRRQSELPYLSGLTNYRVGFRVVLNWENKE